LLKVAERHCEGRGATLRRFLGGRGVKMGGFGVGAIFSSFGVVFGIGGVADVFRGVVGVLGGGAGESARFGVILVI
jgi:hypothetical protein